MSNQYDVLGKAPGPEELKKLSPDNNHVTIKNLSAGYGKMEILHDFDLCVSKAQSSMFNWSKWCWKIYNPSLYLWIYKYLFRTNRN